MILEGNLAVKSKCVNQANPFASLANENGTCSEVAQNKTTVAAALNMFLIFFSILGILIKLGT